jgi:hypothetical protein
MRLVALAEAGMAIFGFRRGAQFDPSNVRSSCRRTWGIA